MSSLHTDIDLLNTAKGSSLAVCHHVSQGYPQDLDSLCVSRVSIGLGFNFDMKSHALVISKYEA